MRLIRIVLLCLAVATPASAQQSDISGKPAAIGFKAKFKEKRAKFVSRIKTIYFATACKILDNEAQAGLVDAEAARVFVRQKADSKIDDLKKQYTIIIVTHNMQQAGRVSDYTSFFYMGDLIEHGPTKFIFTSPKDIKTQNYITGRFG